MYECLNVLNNFCFHVYAQNLLPHFLTPTLSHSHSFSLSHSFNLSFTHFLHAEQLLFSCVCSKLTLTLSHSHSLTLSRYLTLTLFQSLIQSLSTCWTSFVFISMLKSRCNSRKLQWFFFWTSSSSSASAPREFANHRAGSQLKITKILMWDAQNGQYLRGK